MCNHLTQLGFKGYDWVQADVQGGISEPSLTTWNDDQLYPKVLTGDVWWLETYRD